MTLKTLKAYFRQKMMAELEGNAPVYSLLPYIKNYQVPNNFGIPFGFRKVKTGSFLLPDNI